MKVVLLGAVIGSALFLVSYVAGVMASDGNEWAFLVSFIAGLACSAVAVEAVRHWRD